LGGNSSNVLAIDEKLVLDWFWIVVETRVPLYCIFLMLHLIMDLSDVFLFVANA